MAAKTPRIHTPWCGSRNGIRGRMASLRVAVALLAASSVTFAGVRIADACGCVSPPVPDPLGKKDYAVNQLAEQIIFEVEQNWVTAHVLIKYAGDPQQFAWIVPVAEAP